jgi:hypothetical protein
VVSAAIDGMHATGSKVGIQHLHCVVAEAQLAAGRVADARASLAAASAHMAQGDALYAPEIRRLEGLAARAEDDGPGGRAAARRSFGAAIDIARAQGARALELRAAMNLARLIADDGDARRALEALAPLRGRFVDGSDTEDLRRADELMRELREGARAKPAAGDLSRRADC